MQECTDESEIYNYQRIQFSNNKFIWNLWGGGIRLTWLDWKSKHKQGCVRYSGSSRKRKPSGGEKGVHNWIWPQVSGHHIITDSLLCPWGGKALNLSLNSTRLMRTTRSYGHFLWLPQCPWGLRKTGFCESGRNYSCPLTRVSVRRTSTVIAFVRMHPYLGVPVVQSHKFSRYRGDCRISRRP